MWGLFAVGGLTYLGSLAWQPDLRGGRQQVAEPDKGLLAAGRALAQIDTVRRTLGEVQRDLGQVKETLDQREVHERLTQSRLAVIEERVSTMPVAAVAPPPPRKGAEKAPVKAAEPRTPNRIVSVPDSLKSGSPPGIQVVGGTQDEGPPVRIETGSIGAPPPFGEPVVTPSRSDFAVQLGAGPSLEALRHSWSLLVERHGGALATLRPRFARPRNEGGPYRLLAGPLPSRADADKICADMGVGRIGCFSTTYVGEPL